MISDSAYSASTSLTQLVSLKSIQDKANEPTEQYIGHFIKESCNLSDEEMARISTHQKANHLRFGASAIALNLATEGDVKWALSQQFHYPYIGISPDARKVELIMASDPFSEQSESIRSLRTKIITSTIAEGPPRALAVVSPSIGDGKSFLASNLAIAYSQLGGRTLLIDADLRAPRLHKIFEIPYGIGLSHLLAGLSEEDVIHQILDLPSLYILPVGVAPPNPLELIQGPRLLSFLQLAVRIFDHVIVDTSAHVRGTDARLVALMCGSCVAIARRGQTRMSEMSNLLDSLHDRPIKFFGVALNNY